MASNSSQITQLCSHLATISIQEVHATTREMSTRDRTNTPLPLFEAIVKNSKPTIEDLLSKGHSLFESNKDQLSAYDAIEHRMGATYALALLRSYPPLGDGFRHVRNFLLCSDNAAAEAILSSPHTQTTSWWKDQTNLTYFFFLACKNSATTLLYALVDHIDIHCHSELIEYRTPLMWAARYQHTHMVQKLLEKGSSLIIQDLTKMAAWEYISTYCDKQALTELLEIFPLQQETTDTLICQLIEKDENALALLLIDRLDKENPNFWKMRATRTPIFIAACKKNFQAVAEKIAHHLDIYLQEDQSKKTVLMYALECSWKKCILLCLRQGSSLTVHDASGNTAFSYILRMFGTDSAFIQTCIDALPLDLSHIPSCISFLFEIGQSILAIRLLNRAAQASTKPTWWNNKKKLSAIFCAACKQNQQETCTTLLQLIDVNYADESLATPLILATTKGWNTTILQLIQMGASLVAKDSSSKYAWTYITELCTSSFKEQLLSSLPLDSLQTANFIELLYNLKQATVAQALLLRIIDASQKPAWWSNREIVSRLFCWAAYTNDVKTCTQLLDAIDIHFRDRDGDNRTPLMYVAAKGWILLTLKLIAKGACLIDQDSKRRLAWDYIISSSAFDNSALQACMNAISPQSLYAGKLICHLLRNNHHDEALYLFSKSQKESWAWLKNPTICADLFCLLAQKENLPKCTALVDLIDPNFVDAHHKTPIVYTCDNNWQKLLLNLILRGANLHTIHPNIPSALAIIAKKFGNDTVAQILVQIPTEFSAFGHLLVELLETKNPAAKTLLIRLLGRATQPWQTRAYMTKIFFGAVTLYPRLAEALILLIDPLLYNEARQTAFMVSIQNHLNTHHLCLLLEMGTDLTHKNSENLSALELLLQSRAVLVTNTHLQRFFVRCGIAEQALRNLTTHEALLKYLKNDIASSNALSIPAIIFKTIFNEHDYVRKCLQSLSAEERINILHEIANRAGKELQLELINLAFTCHPAHFEIALNCETIPQKNSSRDIYKGLRFLFETFFSSKGDESFESLRTFASRVIHRTAYLGTPPDKSAALVDFYTQIDNAVCNTIQKIYTSMAEIEQQQHSTIQTLLKAKNEEALGLATVVNQFLTEIIGASKYCGGRMIAVAIQEYNRIVLQKNDEIKTMFLTYATQLRQELVSDLCSPFEQSAHAYNLFVKVYGKALSLPGWKALVQFEDPFANAHLSHIEEVREEFLTKYTPCCIATYLQSMLEGEPLHGKFITLLGTFTLEKWQKAMTQEIMARVRSLCKNVSAITAAEKEDIITFFKQAPYFMTLSPSEASSIESIEKCVASYDQLFIALSQKGKSFSLESILFALATMEIIR